MLRRFLAYGFVGWAVEVAFTGLSDSPWVHDRRLRGHSYLWMLPIYGAGGLLLERLHDRLAIRGTPRWSRALAYMAGIYALEFGSASLLDRLIGDVPWRYASGIHLRGYVRLDYAPFWYGCGWLFEPLERQLRKLDRPARLRPRVSAPGADVAWARRPPPSAPAPRLP
ncbi:MAG TPA: hypothetical protein VI356_12380 [Myxococcales bacterium]